jgi:hypothetical protein
VKTIPNKLAAMKEHTQATVMFKMLEDDFKSRCNVFCHDNQMPLEPEPKRKSGDKDTCHDARMCLCGPLGDKRFAARKKMIGATTRLCNELNAANGLKNGDFVWKVIGRLLPADADPEGSPPAAPLETWLHISYFHGNPKFPSFRQLVEYPVPNRHGHITLKGLDSYWTSYRAIRHLVTETTASLICTLYRIFDSIRPLLEIDPALVEVEDTGKETEISLSKIVSARARATSFKEAATMELRLLPSSESEGTFECWLIAKYAPM